MKSRKPACKWPVKTVSRARAAARLGPPDDPAAALDAQVAQPMDMDDAQTPPDDDAMQPDDDPGKAAQAQAALPGLQQQAHEQAAGCMAVVLDPSGVPEVVPAAVGDTDSEDSDDGQPLPHEAAPACSSSGRVEHDDRLTFSQAQLVELLSELTTSKADSLLRTLADKRFTPAEVVGKWPTKASLNEYLTGLQEFEEIKVGELPSGQPIYMQRRRDIRQLMQELMNLCEGAELSFRPLYDEQGNRIYAGVSSGTYIEQQQRTVPRGCGVFLWGAFSDASFVELQGRRFHPVILFPLQAPARLLRRPRSYRRLALLPCVEARHLGLSSDRSKRTAEQNRQLSRLQHRVMHFSLSALLRPLKDLAYRGMTLVEPSSRKRHYYVRPGLWVADILEKNAIASLSPFVASAPEARSDVRTMTQQRDFSHPPADPVLRTERDMHQAIRRAVALIEAGTTAESAGDAGTARAWQDSAREVLYSVGATAPVMSPGAGFGHGIDIYWLLGHCDRLHAVARGVMLRLKNGLTEVLGREHIRALERQLLACPFHPGMRLPRDGLRGNLATATQTRHLFLVLPAMLLACHTSHRAMQYLAAIVDVLAWEVLVDSPRHTEATLQLLEAARCKVIDSLPAGQNWAIPKVLAMTTVATTIRAFGCMDIASTAFGEATHKDMKHSANNTNRHDDYAKQMLYHSLRVGSAAELAEEYAADDVKCARGLLEKVRRNPALHHLGREGAGLRYEAAVGGVAGHVRGLPGRPELAIAFEPALRAWLGGHAALAELPHAQGHKICPIQTVAFSYQRHRREGDGDGVILHVSHSFGCAKRERFPCVAISTGEGREPWFGQVRLLFGCADHLGRPRQGAFVRWFEAVGRGHAPASLAQAMQRLGMQRLRWATRRVRGQVEAWYDCIDAASIMRPVFLQPDPNAADHFFYNHYMR